MAADMSKKPTIAMSKNSPILNKSHKLYQSVRQCLGQTQSETGVLKSRKYTNLLKGIQSAMAAQVPYTIIMMSSFELIQSVSDSQNIKFSKKDDYLFLYKFFIRFGASTLSLLIAQSLCYPLDTVKRRMQLNGSLGHKNLYKNDWHCLQKILKDEGYRGLYSGFGVNLLRCIPLTLIQHTLFINLRFLSQTSSANE